MWNWLDEPRCLHGAVDLKRQLSFPVSVIREIANRLWGAPRIHGEVLKLGIDIGQTMTKGRAPASQGWKTFFHNHA